MNCPNCNSNINPGENFCRICGTKVVTQTPVNQNTVTNNNLNNQNMNQGVPNEQIQLNPNTQTQNMSTPQSNIFINPMPQQQKANEIVNGNQNDSLLNLMQPQPSTNNPSIGTATNQNMNTQFQNSNQNQSMYQTQPEPTYTQQQGSYQQQTYYQQPVQRIGINTESLIDAYIGNNVDKIRNRSFSFCTFFFGMWYTIYRKMWLLTIILFVSRLILEMFLPSFSPFILLTIDIVLSIKFKDIYLNHVKEQVEKIKRENPEKTQEQLISICRKKGGTAGLLLIIIFVAIFALSFLTTYLEYKSFESDLDMDENTGLVGELNVEIPTNFKEIAHVSSSFAMYSLTEETDTCTLNITNNKYFNGKTLEEYIEDEIEYKENDIVIVSEYRVINGNKWYYLEIQRPATTEPIDGNYSIKSIDYYYVTQKNNEIYEVEFLTYLDNTGACYRARSTIENSLRFE